MAENNEKDGVTIILDEVGDWCAMFERVMASSEETWIRCADITKVFSEAINSVVGPIFVRFETIDDNVQDIIQQLHENEKTREAFILAVIMDENQASQSGFLLDYDGWIIGPKADGDKLIAAEMAFIGRRPDDSDETEAVLADHKNESIGFYPFGVE